MHACHMNHRPEGINSLRESENQQLISLFVRMQNPKFGPHLPMQDTAAAIKKELLRCWEIYLSSKVVTQESNNLLRRSEQKLLYHFNSGDVDWITSQGIWMLWTLTAWCGIVQKFSLYTELSGPSECFACSIGAGLLKKNNNFSPIGYMLISSQPCEPSSSSKIWICFSRLGPCLTSSYAWGNWSLINEGLSEPFSFLLASSGFGAGFGLTTFKFKIK